MGIINTEAFDTSVTFTDYKAYEKMPEIFDNTMLAAYRQCPRKFYWSIVCGANPRQAATALQFGLAWHKFLELYYNGVSFEMAYAEACLEIHNPDQKRNASTLYTIAKLYLERWAKDDFHVDHTEIGFLVDIEGFLYGGRLDGIIEHREGIYVMEHKTASRMGPTYFNQWHTSSQVRGYAYGLGALKENVKGVLMNIAYIAKVPDVFREFIKIPKVILLDWKQSAVDTMLNIQKSFNTDVWAQHPDSCNTVYGQCPYMGLCMRGGDYKKLEIPIYEYEPRRWAPYENLNEETKGE